MNSETETETKRTTFIPSVDAQALAKRLEQANIGDVVTYDELSSIIHHNVQHTHRHILYSALKILQREQRKVFGCVQKIGVRRLDDAEIAVTWKHDVKSISRRTSRATRRVSCAEVDKLDAQGKRELCTGLSVMGFIRQFTKRDSVKTIAGAIHETPKRLDYKESLRLFSK